MTWLTYIIISIFTYSVGILLQRTLLKENSSDPIAFSIVSNIVGGALIGFYAILTGADFKGFSEVIPNLIVMTILYAVVFYSMFESLKQIEASEFTILFASRALWTIIVAILLLHESFVMKQIVGTVLIIISVILVSIQHKTTKKFKLGKGQILALVGAFVFGSAFVNDAMALQKVNAVMYTPFTFILPNILLWIIFPKSTKSVINILKDRMFSAKLILLGIFFATSAVTFFLSYQTGRNAAQIASINQTSIILIVFFAVIFLKERSSLLRKLIAAVMSFIGVLLVK